MGNIVNKKQDSAVEDGDNAASGGKKPAEKPISLAPLKFEEALTGLLQVKPGSKGREDTE